MSVTGIGSSNSGWDWLAIVKESQQNNQTTGTTNPSDSSGNGGMQSTNPMLASLASVLNLSTSQIQQDLNNGQSLSQIASAQGVSQSTLLSAIESSLQSSPFGSSASSQQISTMASAIASNTGPFRHHLRRHRTAKARRPAMVNHPLSPIWHPISSSISYEICPSWPAARRVAEVAPRNLQLAGGRW